MVHATILLVGSLAGGEWKGIGRLLHLSSRSRVDVFLTIPGRCCAILMQPPSRLPSNPLSQLFFAARMQRQLSVVSESPRAPLSKHALMLIGAPTSGIDSVRAHRGLSSDGPAFWVTRLALSWVDPAPRPLVPSITAVAILGGRHMFHSHRGLISCDELGGSSVLWNRGATSQEQRHKRIPGSRSDSDREGDCGIGPRRIHAPSTREPCKASKPGW